MGTNKRIVRAWLIILIVITIPVGGYFSLGVEKYYEEKFWLNFIAGAIAMFLVLGTIARIVFGYYRRQKDDQAAYRGLFAYSFTLFFFTLIAVFFYFQIQKEIKVSDFKKELKIELIDHFESLLKEFEMNQDLVWDIEIAAGMICDDIQKEEELCEEMMLDKKDRLTFIAAHPELKSNYNMVIEVVMKSEVMYSKLKLK